MGTPLGPKYIPYTYMDPLGSFIDLEAPKFLTPGYPSSGRFQVLRHTLLFRNGADVQPVFGWPKLQAYDYFLNPLEPNGIKETPTLIMNSSDKPKWDNFRFFLRANQRPTKTLLLASMKAEVSAKYPPLRAIYPQNYGTRRVLVKIKSTEQTRSPETVRVEAPRLTSSPNPKS